MHALENTYCNQSIQNPDIHLLKPYIKLEDIHEKFQPHLEDSTINEATCYFYLALAGKLVASFNDDRFNRVSSNSLEVTNRTIESMFGISRREREQRQRALCKIGFLDVIRQTGTMNIFKFRVGVYFGVRDFNSPIHNKVNNTLVHATPERVQTPCTQPPSNVYRPPTLYITKKEKQHVKSKPLQKKSIAASSFKFVFEEESQFRPISLGGLIPDILFSDFKFVYGSKKVQNVIIKTDKKYPPTGQKIFNPGGMLRTALKNDVLWSKETNKRDEKAMLDLQQKKELIERSDEKFKLSLEQLRDESYLEETEFSENKDKYPDLYKKIESEVKAETKNTELFLPVLQRRFNLSVEGLKNTVPRVPSNEVVEPKPAIFKMKAKDIFKLVKEEAEKSVN